MRHGGGAFRYESMTVRKPTPFASEHPKTESRKLFYASDAYQARLLAIEFNHYIKIIQIALKKSSA